MLNSKLQAIPPPYTSSKAKLCIYRYYNLFITHHPIYMLKAQLKEAKEISLLYDYQFDFIAIYLTKVRILHLI